MKQGLALPQPGDQQPDLSIPTGDLLLRDGQRVFKRLARHSDKFLRERLRPLLAPETTEVACWDEHIQHAESRRSGMRVMATLDLHPAYKRLLLHVSVSYPTRLPTWEEVTAVKDAVYGDQVDVAMILPRKVDYVNLHQFCFQLWQLPTVWGTR